MIEDIKTLKLDIEVIPDYKIIAYGYDGREKRTWNFDSREEAMAALIEMNQEMHDYLIEKEKGNG